MKEVKSPKKPLIYYYGIVLLIIFLFNMIVSPMLMKSTVKEVGYNEFLTMLNESKIEAARHEVY